MMTFRYWDDIEQKWVTANDPGTSVHALCSGKWKNQPVYGSTWLLDTKSIIVRAELRTVATNTMAMSTMWQ